jgi:hypothetical protein
MEGNSIVLCGQSGVRIKVKCFFFFFFFLYIYIYIGNNAIY